MSYLLKNRNLELIIGAPTELYNGSRFDLSGNIFQVTLNGKHTFCTTEKKEHHPNSGFGLVNEFDIRQPFNYASAKAGSWFHKIGVGELLKNEEEPYNFFKKYEKTDLNYSVLTKGSDQIIFQAVSADIRGMKYQYIKRISITNNQLLIEYNLQNIGSHSFGTTEYVHNFMAINHRNIDASYRLKINQKIEPDQFNESVNTEKLIGFKQHELTWKATPVSDFFISGLTGSLQKCNGWTLENHEEKAAVSEVVNFDCTQLNLWGTTHVVSPELFFTTMLLPGHVAVWSRRYTFYEL